MDVNGQNSLHHINLRENGSMYPLPLSSSSSTSSEITESSAAHGVSQGSYPYPSKMSTTSISSDASISSNDNTATNTKYNNRISAPTSLNFNNLASQGSSNIDRTKNQDIGPQANSSNNISMGIGDNLISQAISGMIIHFREIHNFNYIDFLINILPKS